MGDSQGEVQLTAALSKGSDHPFTAHVNGAVCQAPGTTQATRGTESASAITYCVHAFTSGCTGALVCLKITIPKGHRRAAV